MTGIDETESVASLSNNDSGVWLVTTQESQYFIDLEARRIYRIRRRGRPEIPADDAQHLLMIVNCAVGDVGSWIASSDGNQLAQSPYRSGIIRTIRRSSPRARAEMKSAYDTQASLEDDKSAAGTSRGSHKRRVPEIAREIQEKSAVLNERLRDEDRHETTDRALLGQPREGDDR